MATKVRVEWVSLGVGALTDGTAANVLKAVAGTPALLTATGTATAAGSRPQAPAAETAIFARVSALDGNVVAAWGANPTAAQDNGVLIMTGGVELLPVAASDRLSFVELSVS